jgi:FMN phosphatase YigB (HAD superfamily)
MTDTSLRALLLDLDDTLLGNPMETFLPAYFDAMTDFVTEIRPPQRLIQQLIKATRIMDRNDGSGRTNEAVFAEHFFTGLGVDRAAFEPVFARFYAEVFPKLQPLTVPRAAAPEIVRWASDRGLQIVIATNPMFPRTAIEQRMGWAGIGVEHFDFALVTSYENCRATKSNPAYYRGILNDLGRRPAECLMVGDNWDWDIVHASIVGIPGFWIADDRALSPDPSLPLVGRGDLDAFLDFAQNGDLERSLAAWHGGPARHEK